MKNKIISLLMKRDKILIFALFGIATLFCILPLKSFQKNLLETSSLEDARLYSQAIASFRTIYTDEVVNKALLKGMNVTHEFSNDPNTIPLPASFSMMLGHEISKMMHGGGIELYSAYPFPWRLKTGGLQDDFKKEAWKAFQDKSKTEYVQFITEKNIRYIRYAVPDVMRQSCVECHNTHPQSPKRGWKVGDVRGILEVKRPVGEVTQKIAQSYHQTMFQLLLVVTLFLTVLYFVLNFLRNKILQLDEQAQIIKSQQASLIATSRLSALGEMAGGIAHEINNPLGVISLSSATIKKLLEKKQFEDARLMSSLKLINETSERIANIIQSLRVVSRDASKDDFETTSLKEVLKDSLELSREKFKTNGITLKLDLELPIFARTFLANRVQLSQVFLNLFSNSVDAIKELPDKWISIEGNIKDEILTIIYKDSGNGIPKEIQEKIFEPFFTTKKAGQGTGLGLSIVNSIIKKHNGTIAIDNDSRNTCFVIQLLLKTK
jgi:signal transduction histidine kinase